MLFQRINIKSKVLIIMLAVGFIPGLVGIASIYIKGMEVFKQSKVTDLIYITQQIAANIRTTINKEAAEGMLIAQHPGVRTLVRSTTGIQDQLKRSIKDDLSKSIQHKPHATYFIYNQAGNLVLQVGAKLGAPFANASTNTNLTNILAKAVVSDPINSHTQQGYYLPIITPIYSFRENGGDKVIGHLIAYLNISQLLKNIQNNDATERGHFNLLTKSGRLIYDSFFATEKTPFTTQHLDTLISSNSKWFIDIDEHGIKFVVTITPLSLPSQTGLIYSGKEDLYITFTKSAVDAFFIPTRSVLLGAALPGFILALLLILIIYIALKRIVDPIEKLKMGAATIGSGNLDHKIEIQTADEIEDLANEFNKMTTALKSSYSDLEEKVRERTVKLEASYEELEKASHLKSQFFASMSHELRTPLNAIMGFSDVLTEEVYGSINEKQRRYLGNIHQSGKHLLEVINDILDFSKIEAGKMTLHLRELIVNDALTEIQTLVTQLSTKAGVNLSFKTEEAPALVIADCVRFRQIMYNLLSNAIKFTPEGGTITVTVKQTDNNLTVSIEDTGIGIAEEHLQTIFKPFRQIDGSVTRNFEGTGLGLALSKEFVEMHGGQLSVTSKLREGSCFTFTLPSVSQHPLKHQPIASAKPE